jgi:hypothetical protein
MGANSVIRVIDIGDSKPQWNHYAHSAKRREEEASPILW